MHLLRAEDQGQDVKRKYLEMLEDHLANHEREGGFAELQGVTNRPDKTDKTTDGCSQPSKQRTDKTAKIASSYKIEAETLGLVATWAHEFGYISLHDPTTGEWHDMKTEDAPDWAKAEAFRRKDLYKGGNRKAYCLTSREMEELWEAEHPPDEEGIVEEYAIESEEE